MKNFFVNNLNTSLPAFFLLLIFASCSSTKKIKYFQDIPDSGQLKTISKVEYIPPKIQVDDILTVVIQVVDPQAAVVLNTGNVSSGLLPTATASPASQLTLPPSSALSSPSGYLVDATGDITIPILGKFHLAGLNTTEATKIITKAADSLYKNPSVTVRLANFKINIGGEVLKPGTYTMTNEKVTLFDAISAAGDLTIFGKRDNVLLIRENADGTKSPYRLNLKKSDVMSLPVFYLKQNDYIYVQPASSKAAVTDAAMIRNYTILGSVLSVIAIILTRK